MIVTALQDTPGVWCIASILSAEGGKNSALYLRPGSWVLYSSLHGRYSTWHPSTRPPGWPSDHFLGMGALLFCQVLSRNSSQNPLLPCWVLCPQPPPDPVLDEPKCKLLQDRTTKSPSSLLRSSSRMGISASLASLGKKWDSSHPEAWNISQAISPPMGLCTAFCCSKGLIPSKTF